MFPESELLPLSGLQHLIFCERQWGLIHVEQVWAENWLTAEGRVLHDRSDTSETEVRGDLRIARALRIHSMRLGLAGIADVVEFRRVTETSAGSQQGNPDRPGLPGPAGTVETTPERPIVTQSDVEHQCAQPGIRLLGVPGLWRPAPVEYKRGRPKRDRCDEVQLCAQALCLEEMLDVAVAEGALYYGRTRRRLAVSFDASLRTATEAAAHRMHELFDRQKTPPAVYGPKCGKCSLLQLCQPKALADAHRFRRYMAELQGR